MDKMMEINLNIEDKLEVKETTEYIKNLTMEGKMQFSVLIKGIELGIAIAAEIENKQKSA